MKIVKFQFPVDDRVNLDPLRKALERQNYIQGYKNTNVKPDTLEIVIPFLDINQTDDWIRNIARLNIPHKVYVKDSTTDPADFIKAFF